ncbi:hypothetical protein IGK74_002136 [Enterococcus sp. AZ150]|uniref:Uncharacterized protein n=1 Tax=Enterococcus sulfureus ATCC 49903 TaxID=1140003 RepID=S0NXX2_9ENTE|nr:hypothetical protein OMY_01637 [Enterococcus sulfureus ATCC 49903]EOT86199.1 hypothetical protein I573_00952 [Enterococcus sulfureus ATCC 49903]
MRKRKKRFIYLLPIVLYIFVRIVILKIDNKLTISYFLNYELSGVIGFVIGYALLYYLVLRKNK